MDRDIVDLCLVRDNIGDLPCRDICPDSFHLKCISTKKKDGGTFKDNNQTPHNVAFCKVYEKECETTRIHETINVNQDERITLNELREKSENTPDIKIDLIEYNNECSKEQQQILHIDNSKHHKLLDVPIKSKKDNVTESSVVTFNMKESYQQIKTRTIELTNSRSNTNEGNSLSINAELTSNERNVNQDNYPRPQSSSWSSSFSHPQSISLSTPQPLKPKRGRYDHVFTGSPTSKNNNIKVAEIEKKLLTNDNNKEIVPNIPKVNEIQKYDSRYSNHPYTNKRKSKIGKTDIKENSRTANKKSNKRTYTRRTVLDNEISISGVAPQDERPKVRCHVIFHIHII